MRRVVNGPLEYNGGTHSIRTKAAIASTIGTARGTTQGSCLPLVANDPGVPSYCAVDCGWEMVAGDLKPTLRDGH